MVVFTFTGVVHWLDSQRKEREAFYKSETLRRVSEASGEGAKAALELMHGDERLKRIKAREGMKIGGLVNIGVGIGLLIFLHALLPGTAIYLCGMIPGLIGVGFLLYVYVLAGAGGVGTGRFAARAHCCLRSRATAPVRIRRLVQRVVQRVSGRLTNQSPATTIRELSTPVGLWRSLGARPGLPGRSSVRSRSGPSNYSNAGRLHPTKREYESVLHRVHGAGGSPAN